MRYAKPAFFALAAAMVAAAIWPIKAADDMIIVEQNYNIVEHSKDGFNAKDIRQVLYITADIVAIDEFGDNKSTAPTETFLIDIKNQRIVDLDHTEKKILLNETFADRRNQIVAHKKQVQRDMDALVPGAQKNKILKLFAPMMDAARDYKTVEDPAPKEVAGMKCKSVKIIDSKDESFAAFETVLHPELEMPYDNSEVLFLLRIVGEKMALYLRENKATFGHVPMEMHLQLAEGGKLDVKVISVKKTTKNALDPKARSLGDPFVIPDDYKLERKYVPKPKDTPKEKAD